MYSSEIYINLEKNPSTVSENVFDMNRNYFGANADSNSGIRDFQENLSAEESFSESVHVIIEEAEEAKKKVPDRKKNENFSAFQNGLQIFFAASVNSRHRLAVFFSIASY